MQLHALIIHQASVTPVAERLQLVEDLWNSIADASGDLELSEADKRLIDERLETIPSAPSVPWRDALARIAHEHQ